MDVLGISHSANEKKPEGVSFLLVALVLAMGSFLFAWGQISYFFNSKEIVLGSWSEFIGNSVISVDEGGRINSGDEGILGIYQTELSRNQVSAEFKTYQGFVLDLYFKEENSPLYGQGEQFIAACRRHGAPSDCTLLPAIAKVETDLCKAENSFSVKQFNCWGFGGSGPNRIWYKDFPTAIDEITRRLMTGYGAGFFRDPEIGELTYCGAHCSSWGNYVQAERVRINNFFQSKGHPKLF